MITFLINLCFSLPARFLISKPFFIFVVMPIYIYIYIYIFYIDKTKIESDPRRAHITSDISNIMRIINELLGMAAKFTTQCFLGDTINLAIATKSPAVYKINRN
jgi:hypothetical protein